MRPNKKRRATDCKDHGCVSSGADNARIVGASTFINIAQMLLVQ
jgi:hypothetical protein